MNTTLRPGINHIEYWVSNLSKSIKFYSCFLSIIGWEQISEVSFSNGSMVIYFVESKKIHTKVSHGVRHICFQAMEKDQVNQVYHELATEKAEFIRGPIMMPYSKEYYTVDFYDPDGQVVEVAHTPYSKIIKKTS